MMMWGDTYIGYGTGFHHSKVLYKLLDNKQLLEKYIRCMLESGRSCEMGYCVIEENAKRWMFSADEFERKIGKWTDDELLYF